MPNEYRLVIHVCIFNSKGEMLIQQRQHWKKGWPNMWDLSVGGCSVSREESNDTANREVFEELGVKLDFKESRPYITVNFENGFDDYFIAKLDLDLNDLILQKEEVQKALWGSREKIISMLDAGEFIPYHKGLIEFLFDMNTTGYGSQKR